MSKPSRAFAGLLVIFLLAIADQLSKWYIVERHFHLASFDAQGPSLDFIPWLLKLPQERLPFYATEVTSFFNLVMVWNKGVSFGMFTSGEHYMPYVLMVMALALTGFFVVWMLRAATLLAAIPLAMIISGALSNVWDRARFGAVVDFLDFHIGSLHWPAFNIADSCIVLGVASLAIHTLLSNKSKNMVAESIKVDEA